MALNDILAPISNCIEPYYKKRLDLFTKFIGERIVDALLFMPSSTFERIIANELSPQIVGNHVIVHCKIDFIEYSYHSKTRPIIVSGKVGNHRLALLFFNYKPVYLRGRFEIGKEVRVHAKLNMSSYGEYQLNNPQIATFRVKPGFFNVYPQSAGVTQDSVSSIIFLALEILRKAEISEWLPESVLEEFQFYSFFQSLKNIHMPHTSDLLLSNNIYRQRLCFDELLAEQLTIQLSKKQDLKGRAIAGTKDLIELLLLKLPFDLTDDQKQALDEILKDMSKPVPMKRLLQGDVGSGKTIVAILSMLFAIEAGFQCALLAPTEILARQHFRSIQNYLKDFDIQTEILTANEKGKKRKAVLDGIEAGQVKIVVGTHAIFTEKVIFSNLGLVVIDEQHRFGVEQRLNLIRKGQNPHVLSMTATPIPRTIIMSVYGDIDTSSIKQKPQGRKEIITKSFPISRMDEIVKAIERILQKKEKVYWVCPLIEDSDKLDYTCVLNRVEMLQKYFGEQVGMLHGKMKAAEKQEVFERFYSGNINILVATTVIEVGIDVPNATAIIIENAEHFGLAQLHQLRGRVGRSELQSYCILLFDPKCSQVAKKRLEVMTKYTDGFLIAEEDLHLRGGGEIRGTKQSGHKSYKTFEIVTAEDQQIVNKFIITANKLARNIVKSQSIELYSACLQIFAPKFDEDIVKSF